MSYNPLNPNGSATTANSQPVNIASDQTIPIKGGYTEQTGLSAGSLNADLVPSTDVSGYKWFSLHVMGVATGGNLTLQGSNDNSNFVSVVGYPTNQVTQAGITTVNFTGIVHGPINYRYLRVRQTSWSSGSSTGVLELYTSPSAVTEQGVAAAQSGTWNVGGASSLALADGMSNPTTQLIGAVAVGYNGSTDDRIRNNWNTTTGDSGAKAASFNGATQTNYNSKYGMITVLCGTVSGSSPTLSAQLQWSPDAGTTWLNIGPASGNATATGNTIAFLVGPANFAQSAGASPANLTTGATQTVAIDAPLPRTWRVAYTIGGGSPSFAITGVYVNYVGL